MCVQTITTEQDCLYLSFLNNCQADRAYPPLRMYENDDFVIIDAADSKQISISKVGFEVDVNGDTYTDPVEAQRQLAVEIQCVNNSRTGTASTAIDQLIQQGECKESVFGFDDDSAGISFPGDISDGLIFQYWDGSAWVTYEEDLNGTTVNSIAELATLLNTNQTFFEFYALGQNEFPLNYQNTIAIRSLDKDLETEFLAGSFLLGIDGVNFVDTPEKLGDPQCESNLDAIKVNTEASKEKLSTLIDGEIILPTEGVLTAYAPTVANQAMQVDNSDPQREMFVFQVFNGDCWLRFLTATGIPASRQGVLLKDGQSLIFSVLENGRKYFDALSVINVSDGAGFDFTYTKFNKLNQ